ncbi:hypothetical protein LEP1GSC125_1364 [Leptospira mayottensis 200901122]|uniref:Uncharacterized protein n=1 Tax=Leptospira mayottensis 200901122 TaxID=1193010 RepID=A0AA87MRT1_9LEPT|nr:hypothetical protein LEP1GSC125_1364 [Leptospira mayottensis 200901122]
MNKLRLRTCSKTSEYRNLDENLSVIKYARKLSKECNL